jgi:hypothetical protein
VSQDSMHKIVSLKWCLLKDYLLRLKT